MVHDPLLPHSRAELPGAPGDLRLPKLSAERKGTLQSIHARIDAFAEHLSSARAIFSETQKREPGSLEAKAAIFNAKQHVQSALHELDSSLRLIDLNPDQVSHIATHLHRASLQLNRIKGLSELILRTTRTTHHPKALDILALACHRASYELESSLGEPLKRTLRAPRDS
jgi:hypothetical protein